MAEITLKAYIAHVDDLLSRRQYEHAELHCKHILAKYPKNLAVLRRYAKAQFEAGRNAESEATYALVLSMEPRASDAYVGLSWVARQRGQGDQTIALLERAYEQDTNNQDVIQLLRDAHRTFNDRANAKLPQTPYIAARQQYRSGLNQQAVATLNAALAADPGRADIRILKMQIHLQAGESLDAARAATELVKQLPDCVEANRMLTEFWKAQGRPSDAQRFIAHVEAADPFLAFEIATGAPPPDEALMLSLLEVRAASEPAVTDTPDWMSQLGTVEPTEMSMKKVEPETIDWLSRAEPVQDEEETLDRSWLAGAIESSEMPEDMSWLTEAAAHDTAGDEESPEFDFGKIEASAPIPDMGMDWMEDAEAVDEGDTLDSISTKMAQEEAKSAKVLGELSAMSKASEQAPAGDAAEPAEEEWMSALADASADQTTPDREEFDDFLKNFTSFGELTSDPATQSSGTGLTGLLGNPALEEPAPEKVSRDIADIDPQDPLAWMRAGALEDSGAQEDLDFDSMSDMEMPDLDTLLSDESYEYEVPETLKAEETPQEEEPADDRFAWMQGHDIDMVAADAPKAESLWDDPMGVANMTNIDQSEADPLAWMQEAGVGLEEEVDPDADPLAWAKESGLDLLEDVGQANFKATAALSADMALLGAEEGQKPSPFDEIASNQPPPSTEKSGLLAFLKDDAGQGGDSPMTDNQLPDWLNEPDDEDKKPEASEAGDLGDFDWMAAAASEQDAEVDWDAAPETGAADESAPDWLAALDNPVDAAEVAALSAKDDPKIDIWDDAADDAITDAPDWMKALRDESASAEEPATGAEDWIFSEGEAVQDVVEGAKDDLLAAPAEAAAAIESKAEEAEDEFADWLSAAAPAEAAAPVEAAADESLDWLSAAAPAEAAAAVESAAEEAEDEFADWLSAAAPAEAAAEAAAPVEAAADESLDWLSAAAPEEAAAAVESIAEEAEDEFADWLSAAAPAEAAAESAAPVEAAADESLDWLSAAAPAEAAAAVESTAEEAKDEFADWLSAAAPAEAAAPVEATADESLDWLSAAAPEEAEAAVEGAAAAGMEWMDAGDDGVGDETNAFIAHDSLDWLTADAAASDAGEDAERAVSPEFMGQAGDTAAEFGSDFDFAAADAESPSFEMSFLEDDESTEDVATVELEGDPLPDWLMEAKADAALKMDVDVPEDQLRVQGELSGEILDDADLLEAEPPVEESLSASAVNSPDWLNAMVPGLDVGGEMVGDEEEPAEESEFLSKGSSDFAWLTSLVDEELAPPAAAAPPRRTSRFPFSEPPGWLAMLRDETQGSSPVLDLDTDDDSLPDWLKFDDAETK